LVRAALISIAAQPRDAASGVQVCIGGKPLAERQLAFALSAGAERIILLGQKDGAEAEALRHLAERAGAKVQQVETAHGLLGIIGATDELLVIAPGLLPEAPEALEPLGKGSAVLILPSALGVAAGFERIDLERAWAGAVVVPGRLVERLAELPSDIEAASALLRIALQARVPDRKLPEAVLVEGSWAMVDDRAAVDRAWLRRNLGSGQPSRPSDWLAHQTLQRAAGSLLGNHRTFAALLATFAALLAAAIAAAAFGIAPLGFVLLALGAFTGALTTRFARLVAAPFAAGRREAALARGTEALVEIALALCAVLAIEGDLLHRLFPPVVLVGLLRAAKPAQWPGATGLLGDPLVLALVLAVAAALGLAEPAVMALALTVIVLQAAKSPALRD
jgi:hypothetical protein